MTIAMVVTTKMGTVTFLESPLPDFEAWASMALTADSVVFFT